MAHDHDHDHDHGGGDDDCCTREPTAQDRQQETAYEQSDPARQSLAGALRVSFVLLSGLMVAALALLLASGAGRVDAGARGVRLLLGRIQGEGAQRVLAPGLNWAWPEPIGKIETVRTEEEKLEINDFWMYETPEEASQNLRDRIAPSGGLRPGLDGALLTGDRALVHVKLICRYRVDAADPERVGENVMNYLANVTDAREMVRSAVCNAAIQAAALRTVDFISGPGRDQFAQEIAALAQKRLDEMRTGLRIVSVPIDAWTPPLAALKEFDEVLKARQEAEAAITKAKSEAATMLEQACGKSWQALVGEVERADLAGGESGGAPYGPAGDAAEDPVQLAVRFVRAHAAGDAAAEALGEQAHRVGWLPIYALARERQDDASADLVLAEIDRVLVSNTTGGEAASLLSNAKAYAATICQQTEARAQSYVRLLAEYEKSPDLMINRQWAAVKEEILSSPTVEKFYLSPGQKTVIRMSPDPENRRKIMREGLKTKP